LFADIIKVYAVKSEDKNGTIILQKPVIIYKDYIIQALKGTIKNRKTVVLEKNVTIFYQDSAIAADKVTVYSKNDIFSKNNIIYDRHLDIWFKTNNAKLRKELIYFKSVDFSSCCINDPDWYIHSTSGVYNKKTKYVKLYNLTLYIHDVPVFYFPFYFNSLEKKRRSGLLRPYIGYSNEEGLLYTQPVYFVLGQRADIEFDPTIRTLRGKGLYTTFRFVDSPNSYGELKLGRFLDKSSYQEKYDLAHREHYGGEFLYTRDKIINENDSLYVDLKKANDVEYFYLNPFNYRFDTKYLTNKTITSEANYIVPFKKDYFFGTYFKYFDDTTKKNNDYTVELLPQLNLHKFETKNFILNSFDANFYNYWIKRSKNYYVFDFNAPLSITGKIYKDYLYYKLSENFNFMDSNYYDSTRPDDKYKQVYTSFKIYSSLIKKSSYLHIINPAVTFYINHYKSLDIYNNLINPSPIENSVNFNLFQIFEIGDFYIDHTINQTILYENYEKNQMENTLNLKYKNFSLKEYNRYSWKYKHVMYNSINANLEIGDYSFGIGHLYNYKTLKSVSFNFEKKISAYKSFYVDTSYDLLNHYSKYVLFGLKLSKKCWKYNIGIKRNRIPILTDTGVRYRDDYVLSIDVYFNPIGGVRQSFVIKGKNEN